jgi:dolichol-phosphate mannosyltransferase
MKALAVVVPAYNEEKVLPLFIAEIIRVMDLLIGYQIKVIFVNDGSRDSTATILNKIVSDDNRFTVVHLARNFGHQIAITAGMDLAMSGGGHDAVVVIDADLQDPPAVILDLVKTWEAGSDIVYAVREKRTGETIFKKFTAWAYYRALRKLAGVEIPADCGDFRLMARRPMADLCSMRERSRYIRGLVAWLGYRTAQVMYTRAERVAGSTHYTLAKMIRLATDGIVSFSTWPLRIGTFVGAMASLAGMIGIAWVIFTKLFSADVVPGWASVLCIVLAIGGINMMLLGILGVYVGKIYEEVIRRPLYTIQSVAGIPPLTVPQSNAAPHSSIR